MPTGIGCCGNKLVVQRARAEPKCPFGEPNNACSHRRGIRMNCGLLTSVWSRVRVLHVEPEVKLKRKRTVQVKNPKTFFQNRSDQCEGGPRHSRKP